MPRASSMRYRCNCGGALYVKETRASDDAIYRVRKCRECSWFFTTKEVAVEEPIPRSIRRPSPVDAQQHTSSQTGATL